MSEEKSSNMFSNAKLSTIFMVVLGLHVVVIVLISAYHLLKGDTSVEMTQRISAPEPRSYESILTDVVDERSPEVVTAYDNAEIARTTEGQVDETSIPMTMPSINDPIWPGHSPAGNAVVSESTTEVEQVAQTVVSETKEFPPAPVVAEKVEAVQEVAPSVAATRGVEYTVKKGDTLSRIASRHNIKVADIQKTNQLDSSMIRIGQKLTLPGVNALAVSATPEPVKAPVKPAPRATIVSAGTYKVAKGDTLWKISRKFSTTPQVIASLNGISDPSKLRVGDTLKVPGTSSSAASGAVETSTDMAMIPSS